MHSDCRGVRVFRTRAADRMSWLGAVSIHSRDYDAHYRAALAALLAQYGPLHLIVNHFDAAEPSIEDGEPSLAHPRLRRTWVPGMKGLFWKRELTAERMQGVRALWCGACAMRESACVRVCVPVAVLCCESCS